MRNVCRSQTNISSSTLYLLLLLQGYDVKTTIFIATMDHSYGIIDQPSSLLANLCSVILNLIARNLQSSDHGIAVFA